MICFRLLTQLMRRPFSLALARAGRSKPARMAIMAITTNNSISVNAERGLEFSFFIMLPDSSLFVDLGAVKSIRFHQTVCSCMSFAARLYSQETVKHTGTLLPVPVCPQQIQPQNTTACAS